eukprot:c11821_g1_i2.p1 GENE.c11821_g1_i2~~c11821_g1_i2.p1  ORF type:complete len:286 (+),score=47.32 c11821_g1_i2:150-1007(+)
MESYFTLLLLFCTVFVIFGCLERDIKYCWVFILVMYFVSLGAGVCLFLYRHAATPSATRQRSGSKPGVDARFAPLLTFILLYWGLRVTRALLDREFSGFMPLLGITLGAPLVLLLLISPPKRSLAWMPGFIRLDGNSPMPNSDSITRVRFSMTQQTTVFGWFALLSTAITSATLALAIVSHNPRNVKEFFMKSTVSFAVDYVVCAAVLAAYAVFDSNKLHRPVLGIVFCPFIVIIAPISMSLYLYQRNRFQSSLFSVHDPIRRSPYENLCEPKSLISPGLFSDES